MMTKTKLHPLLQQVYELLPRRIRDRVSFKHSREAHLDIPLVGWVEALIYDRDDPDGLMLHFTGSVTRRSRRYPIRKDGSINHEKLLATIVETFDEKHAWNEEYDRQQAESAARFEEARRVGPIIFKKLRTGRRYQKKDHETYAGGFFLIHRASERKGEVWADDEECCSGTIPFSGLPVEKLNEILRIIGKAHG